MFKLIKDKIYNVNKIDILYNHKSMAITIVSLILVVLFSHYIRYLFKIKFTKNIQNFVITAHPVQKKDIPIIINANGKVQSITSVLIKPQVDGMILNAYFEEGSMVTKGQLLFEIDPSTLQAVHNQATANFNRSLADLKNAELQLDKYTKLYQKKFVAEQDYQQILANFKISKANNEAAIAALDASKVQLDFTKIYSPINGIAGEILVKPGNVIKMASNVGLVNINQLNPIQVAFTVPDEYLSELAKNVNQSEKFKVKLTDYNKLGRLVFLDNHVDELSGTILLKAEFCNANYVLWPGKFVNIDLHVKTLTQALVVPNRAVQFGQQGNYVYVVEKIKNFTNSYIGKTKRVSVKISEIFNNETVILDGLQADQSVVTEGHSHLIDNMVVEIYADQ